MKHHNESHKYVLLLLLEIDIKERKDNAVIVG